MTGLAHLDPLLVALVEKLPRTDAVFTSGDRERWLVAMGAALELLYPPEWSQEARQRAREARVEVGGPVTAERLVEAVLTVAQARIEHEATEAVRAATGDVRLHATLDTSPLTRGASSTTSADAVDGATSPDPGGTTTTGVDAAEDTSSPHQGREKAGEVRVAVGGTITAEQVEAMRRSLEGTHVGLGEMTEEAAPSTTSADAVDDESGGADSMVAESDSPGAGDAPSMSSAPLNPSPSAPTRPSTDGPAPAVADPIPPPQPNAKRRFTPTQKGDILRRCVREGFKATADDTLIHESTLHRWAREMPVTMKEHQVAWAKEQELVAEVEPTAEELEAERETPVPARESQQEAILRRASEMAAKPAVAWPEKPIERRPVDHEAVRRAQADWA